MKALVLGDTTPLAKTLIAALIAADEVRFCFVFLFFFLVGELASVTRRTSLAP